MAKSFKMKQLLERKRKLNEQLKDIRRQISRLNLYELMHDFGINTDEVDKMMREKN